MLLIIDNFVPVEVKTRLYQQARYDEEQEEWSLNSNNIVDTMSVRRPVSVPSRRRPVSEHALNQAKEGNKDSIRYKGENIVEYELDMPWRTTYEYKNPKVSATLQAALAEFMQNEDDIMITDQQKYVENVKSRLDKIINRNSNGMSGSVNNSVGQQETLNNIQR